MSGGVFLLRGEDELVEMRESPYEAEDVLQALIARFPTLLGGDQYSPRSPRQWLLVAREAALPDDEDAAGRWSVDHLFLDQDAVPTLVEVKRSSDTRIRREVVGQMLDYAANGVVYWPLERLRELFARQCERDGKDPDSVVSEVAGGEADVEEFWTRVGENLRAGKVRMVFVSDEIPRELRRVVEFLNGQMNPAEVIAIEVKQYLGADGTKTLVPRVIGQTEAATNAKSAGSAPRRPWDQARWLSELDRSQGAAELDAVRKLLEWASSRGLELRYGSGATVAGMRFGISDEELEIWPFSLWPNGNVELAMKHMVTRSWAPFDHAAKRQELRERLEQIPGVSIPTERLDKWPTFPTSLLIDDQARSVFTESMDWVFAEARAAARGR